MFILCSSYDYHLVTVYSYDYNLVNISSYDFSWLQVLLMNVGCVLTQHQGPGFESTQWGGTTSRTMYIVKLSQAQLY